MKVAPWPSALLWQGGNLASVLFHDSIADAQTEAGSLSHLFGGEEGIENFIGMGNPVTVVAERNFDGISGLRAHDLDAGWAANFVHGIVSVVQDIEKNLLQLMRVADDLGQSLIEVLDDIDAVTVEIVRTQLNGAPQNKIQLHRIALRWHLAREAEQVLHDLLGTLRFGAG